MADDSAPIVFHETSDVVDCFRRRMGLHVVEHPSSITVTCPGCTERQDYIRTDTVEGWSGRPFLHDIGCPHFRKRVAKLRRESNVAD